MAEDKNPSPPENLPTDQQEEAQSDGEKSTQDIKPQQDREEASPGGGRPPRTAAGISNRAIWIGLLLFMVGIVAGGAVGWSLFITGDSEDEGPVAQDPSPGQEEDQQPDQPPQPREPEPQLTPAQERDEERVDELADLRIALELYKDQSGSYPASPELSRSTDENYALSVLVKQGHIDSIPQDPLRQAQDYYYGYESEDGNTYRLSAVAEARGTPCRQIRENLCIIEYSPDGLLNQAEQSSANNPENSTSTGHTDTSSE